MPLNKIANNEFGVINKNHNKNKLFQSLGCTTVCTLQSHVWSTGHLFYCCNLRKHPCSLTTERLVCNGTWNKDTFLFCPPLHFKHEHSKLANFGRPREKDKDAKEKWHCSFFQWDLCSGRKKRTPWILISLCNNEKNQGNYAKSESKASLWWAAKARQLWGKWKKIPAALQQLFPNLFPGSLPSLGRDATTLTGQTSETDQNPARAWGRELGAGQVMRAYVLSLPTKPHINRQIPHLTPAGQAGKNSAAHTGHWSDRFASRKDELPQYFTAGRSRTHSWFPKPSVLGLF